MTQAPTVNELTNALKARVMDPELGVNIVDLGLVERLEASGTDIALDLIMTTPTCPQGHGLAEEAKRVLEQAAPGHQVTTRLLSSPLWSQERMSDEARRQLGWKTGS
jgi:metal-sulfur cluster biosynthetic enzyme